MIIYVDADACPVKDIVLEIALIYNIKVIMVIDDSHILDSNKYNVVTVDKANDSVDFAIINRLKAHDIVVTQDYGLASLVLNKKAYAINQNGFVYDNSNIERLLFERHMNKKIRKSGGRMSAHKKRTVQDNMNFYECFNNLLYKITNKQKED